MYYVYRHIRLDTNEIFYIGIGTVNQEGISFKAEYYRAFQQTKSRSNHWKNIIAISDYDVEIVFETDSIEEVMFVETELIAIFKDTVCNQTSGGLGINSYNHTEEAKQKIANTLRGTKRPKEVMDRINKAKERPIIISKMV